MEWRKERAGIAATLRWAGGARPFVNRAILPPSRRFILSLDRTLDIGSLVIGLTTLVITSGIGHSSLPEVVAAFDPDLPLAAR